MIESIAGMLINHKTRGVILNQSRRAAHDFSASAVTVSQGALHAERVYDTVLQQHREET
jgi:hypothetical protein